MEEARSIMMRAFSCHRRVSRNRRHHNRVLRWGQSPKSTTIYRLLFARVGNRAGFGPRRPLAAQTVSQMVDNVLSQPEGKKASDATRANH